MVSLMRESYSSATLGAATRKYLFARVGHKKYAMPENVMNHLQSLMGHFEGVAVEMQDSGH
jgi:hypothetical protein